MIKFIASDLDGTLLQNGAQKLSDEIFDIILKLKEKGILFAAASGRQYPNVKRLFYPVWEDMAFICENGSVVVYKDEVVWQSTIDKEMGMDIIRDIISIDDCDVITAGYHASYIQPKTKEYSDFLFYTVKNCLMVVDDILKPQEPFLKISAYQKSGIEKGHAQYFIDKWGDKLDVAVSGFEWVDFTTANKGTAMKHIKEKFGFTSDEMMAFGDNFNDIHMLNEVSHSFAMENAKDQVKDVARYRCKNVEVTLRETFLK